MAIETRSPRAVGTWRSKNLDGVRAVVALDLGFAGARHGSSCSPPPVSFAAHYLEEQDQDTT